MNRKRLAMALAAFLVVQLLTVGVASAKYDPSYDITISVTLLEEHIETSDSTGDATFELQEGVHDALTTNTGQEVDHSYIWIKVNGKRVLAIDPPKPCFN